MELPFSRYQCISLDGVQTSCKSSSQSWISKTLASSGSVFSTSRRKWRSSFSQIKCSILHENLQPRLKPKPSKPQLHVMDKAERKGNQITCLGLFEKIEKDVLCNKYQDALDLLENLECEGCHDVGCRTYDALVSACIGFKSIRGVKKMLNHMFRSGFEPDQYMSNRVLLALVKCGMMIDARNLFDKMPQRNSASWNTMIGGLLDSGDYVEAFHLFVETWSEDSDVDSHTLATMLRACAGLGLVYIGKQVHSCAIKMNVSDNIFVSCALIDMYSKCGSMNDAQFVFDEMPEKTTIGWNTIITGYALHGYSEEALSLYYEMQDSGAKLDHFTFSIVVRICARLGSLERAKQAHAALVRQGFTLDVVANTALVDLYSKWGRIEDAKSVFDRMPSKNIISWNALIAGYGNHGRGQEAVDLFYQMLKQVMKPNHVTFLAVLSACSYSGLSDHGWEIFDSMIREHNVKPRAMHYACMVELLGREGLLDEAIDLIRDAPFRPTVNMWAALLTACRVHKNLELGKFAAEKLYGMEPEKLSNYIVLLNIYNSSGKLEDAASVVQTLRRKGLRILQTCTWVEFKKESHSFSSGDKSHPQTKEIYEKLQSLLLEISKRGYVPEKGQTLLPDVDDKEERMVLCHSEKLAVAYGLISTSDFTPLQLVQNHRVCNDCHTSLKLIAEVTGREIVLRDASRFHRFKNGSCSCGDYW